jgi:hypothetical protein
MDKINYAFDFVSSFVGTIIPYLDELVIGVAIAVILLIWIGAGIKTTSHTLRH